MATTVVSNFMMTADDINLAREWLATIEPVGGIKMLPSEMQKIIDTIEEALEIAMEIAMEKVSQPS